MELERKRVDVYHHSAKDSGEVTSKRCAWCSGTGTVTEIITGTKRTCDVCGGTGHNVFSGIVKLCARCKGSGAKGKTLVMSARIKCDVCKGKGYNEFG
jgi:DnaJ-class molecular chaperone